ncbi:MAG: HigA family addiction module antitoxin [Spirochaetia bacterium]
MIESFKDKETQKIWNEIYSKRYPNNIQRIGLRKLILIHRAKDTNVPATRISQIVKGNRRITADTALRFSKYFGNSADFWLGIQDEFDLRQERRKIAHALEKIPHVKAS